ncbi:MAG: hypothetical protein PHI37_02305 [Candidatus Gracilibacteria bacterium]|nr:hypothetical protein [Candidatus Gracilibacteria bacterium]
MNNNIKILAGALITAITATSIGVSFADDTTNSSGKTNKKFERQELTTEQKSQMEAMRTILDKKRNGETLTAEEETQLAEFEANKPEMGRGEGKGMGRGNKGGFLNDLTTEEKTTLEAMSDDEKKAFFETKKAEMQARREAHEAVIDKLLAGEKLTSDEELVRTEIVKERAERKAKIQELND